MSKLDEPVGSYLTVSQNDVTIPTGDTYQIKVETINTENPITYESSDPTVATVDANGLVTSVADGEAIITVSVAGDAYYKEGTTQVKVAVKRPLTFEALEDGQINVDAFVEKPVYYTVNGGEKKAVSYDNERILVSKGDKVEFESANEGLNGSVRICPWSTKCAVYGNVMSMITPDGNYHTNKAITKPRALYGLLYGYIKWDNEKQETIYCTVSHDKYKLVLPATELAEYCYGNMLTNTGITKAPELPATELAPSCYQSMFSGCGNLTKAPELPATKLANNCYDNMFRNDTSLVAVPQQLPAVELPEYSYRSMFYNCKKLTTAPEIAATKVGNSSCAYMFSDCENLTKAPQKLAATEVDNNGYRTMFQNCKKLTAAPEIAATKMGTYSCYFMFNGCESLTKAPQLSATKLATYCYAYMFQNCNSLTAAPELPATELATYCYVYMFRNCTKLSSVKCMAVTMSNYAIYGWLYNAGTDESVTTRTFTHAAENTKWVNNDYGSGYDWCVPTGWTIQAAK